MTWLWGPMLVGLALSVVTTIALLLKQILGIETRRSET
jgi:hypothetical protein